MYNLLMSSNAATFDGSVWQLDKTRFGEYTEIAKKGDSFDRLLARGHKARQEILANEPQRYPGARVSDETFLSSSPPIH